MKTLDAMSRPKRGMGAVLLTLAISGALMAGYVAVLDTTQHAIYATLKPVPEAGSPMTKTHTGTVAAAGQTPAAPCPN